MDSPEDVPTDALDRRSPVPVYVQVALFLRQKITSGQWPAHFRLQTEPELASHLGISRGTLRKALDELMSQGLLRRVHGRGTFVTSGTIATPMTSQFSTLSETLSLQGLEFTSTVLNTDVVKPPARIAQLLQTSLNDPVFRLERIRSDHIGPFAYLVNFVRYDQCPNIENVDFTTTSLFEHLESTLGLPIDHGHRTMTSTAATRTVAEHLHITIGEPVTYLEQITYLEDSAPIEYSDIWINPSRMHISAVVHRTGHDAPKD